MLEFRKDIREENTLDLLLIMDCTSSMKKWLEQAKDKILLIIDKIKDRRFNYSFRVGFVGYTDHC